MIEIFFPLNFFWSHCVSFPAWNLIEFEIEQMKDEWRNN